MRKLSFLATALFALLSVTALAQNGNEVLLYDGNTEFTSRGTSGANAKFFMQRIPGDQIGGATTVIEQVMVLQDQNECTAQTFTIELRKDDGTGLPDVTAGGIIATATFTGVDFPTTNPPCGAIAVQFTITWTGGVPLPAVGCKVPDHDLYLTVNSPPEPTFPADGLSQHCSAVSSPNVGEQMKTTAVGYTGAVGVAGLGWQYDATLATPPTLGSANRAWRHGVRLTDDVLQRFADNAAVFTGVNSGLNPNFGYAGIWPDAARGDMSGLRLRSSAPVGSPSWLLASLTKSDPPATHPFVTGVICLGTPFFHVPPIVVTGAPSGQATSEATFGPYPIPAGLPVGLAVHKQAATLVNGGANFQMSTLCTGYFY